MDQSELLELARAAMQKKRGNRKRGAAKALARGASPPAPPKERDGRGSRTSDVESALARIAAVDARVADAVLNEGAEESIKEAEARALSSASVREADRRIAALDQHIADDHIPSQGEFPVMNPTGAGANRKNRLQGRIRDAFAFSLLLGKPKSFE